MAWKLEHKNVYNIYRVLRISFEREKIYLEEPTQ